MVPLEPGTVAARFVSLCRLDPQTGCWVWHGRVNTQGRLLFRPGCNEPLRSALKWSWQLFVGRLEPRRDTRRLLGCSKLCVCPWHLRSKQPRRQPRLKDARKFSREVIAEIRASRMRNRDIARHYGMSQSEVSKVRSGQIYADVVCGLAVEPAGEKERRLRDEFYLTNRAVLDSLIESARRGT
jgi:hypothetical protein